MRRFVDQFRHGPAAECILAKGQSGKHDPVRVARIEDSDCFQIIDGHHRAAMAFVRGETSICALPEKRRVVTPLQALLKDVLWFRGRRELYQPLDAPELSSGWMLVRRCSDRLQKMAQFLEERCLIPPHARTYLDIGSFYGWFVAKMGELGFDCEGVERDPVAASIGVHAYGVQPSQIHQADAGSFLRRSGKKYDVISCLSVLHHFVMGNGAISAEECLRFLDGATTHVLFVEMGQQNEEWYREDLVGWDADFIEGWLRRHSSFRQIHRLGTDEDAVRPFEKNFSRMMFACVR
jgi:SAM-dependent methyltransferase